MEARASLGSTNQHAECVPFPKEPMWGRRSMETRSDFADRLISIRKPGNMSGEELEPAPGNRLWLGQLSRPS